MEKKYIIVTYGGITLRQALLVAAGIVLLTSLVIGAIAYAVNLS